MTLKQLLAEAIRAERAYDPDLPILDAQTLRPCEVELYPAIQHDGIILQVNDDE